MTGQSRPPVLATIGWLVAWPLVRLLRFFQKFISPLLPPLCRFHPTCSTYAIEALNRHGLWRGLWLTARRLSRCHPFNPGGCDPVPSRERRCSDAQEMTFWRAANPLVMRIPF